jgi:alkanesulfonate monooxygenase SsuD/methylene tetrahydromethanopterin reductase-like flavin-dependent oxidoreductase (luciferase family)
MAVGTPDRVIGQIKLWQEIGVDRMVFILNTAEQIPQEKVLNSLRLFAEKVMPAFDKDAAAPAVEPKARDLSEAPMPV